MDDPSASERDANTAACIHPESHAHCRQYKVLVKRWQKAFQLEITTGGPELSQGPLFPLVKKLDGEWVLPTGKILLECLEEQGA